MRCQLPQYHTKTVYIRSAIQTKSHPIQLLLNQLKLKILQQKWKLETAELTHFSLDGSFLKTSGAIHSACIVLQTFSRSHETWQQKMQAKMPNKQNKLINILKVRSITVPAVDFEERNV